MNVSRRKAAAFLAASLSAGAAAVAMVPRAGVDGMTDAQPIATLFPESFGAWRIDPSVIPVEPGAEVRKTIAETYDQVLSRTYVDAAGYQVMLSVAYGGRRNQGMDLHRPEICYPAQGFALRRETRETTFRYGDRSLQVKRLVAGAGNRNEPVTYWLVIGHSVASFGYGHRLALLRYGLTGRVPDGLLLRVSSVDADEPRAFEQQDVFLRDMLAALAPGFRRRLLGQDGDAA
jgi:EpsI family protein